MKSSSSLLLPYESGIFREEATSVLPGFHAGPLSMSNWNLEMLGFQEGGKPEKIPRRKKRTNNKLNPHMEPNRDRIRAHWWDGGDCFHHCNTPSPHLANAEMP